MSEAPGPVAALAVDASPPLVDPFDEVVGQVDAVAQLRAAIAAPIHAYLLVGPPGSGKRAAARAFAGELLAAAADRAGDVAAAARHRRLARDEAHADLEVVEREGPFITRDQARAIVTSSMRSPTEGDRKVLLLTEFHLVVDAAPILLKAIEEPPPPVVFVILADEIPPELVTIASRCVVIRFDPLPVSLVVERLVAEGVAPDRATMAAEAAGGDLRRARLLATDERLGARAATWAGVVDALDGTGATVVRLVGELLATLDETLEPLDARHAAELAELADREKRYGLRSGRKAVEDRQRRERRRLRTDELRFGLAMIARAERDRLRALVTGHDATARADLAVFGAVQHAVEALERNPNERLLLERLLIGLRPLR